MSKASKDFAWSLLVSLAFILLKGYWFNCSDQEEHLPQVYKLINTQLYSGDYFVEPASSLFTIRWFYVYTVYFFAVILSVSSAVFILHILSITITAFFILKTAACFFDSQTARLLAPFFVLLIFNNQTVGGNSFEDIQLTCTVFANAGCMAAIYFFLKEKYVASGVACGLAALYQVLMGLHIFIILFAFAVLIKSDYRIKKLISLTTTFLIFSLPMLIPVLLKQIPENNTGNDLFYYTLYVFRNSNHYLPSFFPADQYLRSGMLLFCAIALVLLFRHRQKKIFLLFSGIIITGMLLYYITLEHFHWMQAGKIQWFKTSTWLTAMCSIIISGYLGQATDSLVKSNLYAKFPTWSILSACILFLLVIFNSEYLPGKLKSNCQIGNYHKSNLTLMHEWIKDNTPQDALFLSFPSDESFLCQAQRPLAIAFKAIIHEPWFMNKWYADFTKFYSVSDSIIYIPKNAISIAEKSFYETDNSAVLKENKIKYRLLEFSKCRFTIDESKIIYRQGDYILTLI